MIAFLSIIFFFLYLMLMGRGIHVLSRHQMPLLRGWLLAPAIGYATLILLVALPNFYGLPIKDYATIIAALTLIPLIIGVWSSFQLFPKRQMGIVGGILLFCFLYLGWPLFLYGFNWVALANGDAAHFSIIAHRLITQPFFYEPSFDELAGFNESTSFIFHHTMANDRFGTEAVLSWVACITKLKPLMVYMPIILAVAGVKICTLGGVLLQFGKFRNAAYLAMFLLATSPVFAFGILAQLLPQTGGIALMLTLLILLTNPLPSYRRKNFFPHVALTGLIASALCILYPEVTPFLALSVIIYWGIYSIKTKTIPLPFLSISALASLVMVFLINTAFVLMVAFMFFTRIPGGLKNAKADIFPYYLVPSGFPALIGIQPFNETNNSFLITLGLLSIIIICFLLWKSFKSHHSISFLFLAMFSLFVFLIFQGNGFGSFKMAMYLQPALWGFVAFALATLKIQRPIWFLAIGIFALIITYPTHYHYIKGTFASSLGQYQDSRGVSIEDEGEFNFPPNSRLFLDLPNEVFQRWTGVYTDGHYAYQANHAIRGVGRIQYGKKDFSLEQINQNGVTGYSSKKHPTLLSLLHFLWPNSSYGENVAKTQNEVIKKTLRSYSALGSQFVLSQHPQIDHFKDFFYLGLDPSKTPFNKLTSSQLRKVKAYRTAPLDHLNNFLVFINSSRGWTQDFGERFTAALFPAEQDIYKKGSPFFRVGDYLLLQVLNPQPKSRLRLSFTRTINMGGYKHLDNLVEIEGTNKVFPQLIGHGTANVFSPPLQPLKIDNMHFIAIKFNAERFQFPTPKKGLMRLYGLEYEFDLGQQIGFARDFSLVSESQFQEGFRPRQLHHFPEDLLKHPYFEFSGIYEDGWLSQESYFIFGNSKAGQHFYLEGQLPGVKDFQNKTIALQVFINDQAPETITLNPGDNNLKIPISSDSTQTKIRLRFSHAFIPEKNDTRTLTFYSKKMGLTN